MSLFQEKVVYQDEGGGDECVYEGQWSEDGKRHGVGVLFLKDGVKYSGEFSNGFFHGSGILTYPDGSSYEGSLQLGKFHGYGVYRSSEGMKYEVSSSEPFDFLNSNHSSHAFKLVDNEPQLFISEPESVSVSVRPTVVIGVRGGEGGKGRVCSSISMMCVGVVRTELTVFIPQLFVVGSF